MVIDVPKGDKLVDCEGRFYIRVGNTTQQIEGDELKKLLLKERGMQRLDQESEIGIDALSLEALSFFLSKGKAAGRIPVDVEADFKTVLDKFQLINDGKLTDTAVLLFHPNPYSVNYGAFAKVGLFDDDGLLLRDDIIRCPLIQLADETMKILLDKYIQPTYGYGGGGDDLQTPSVPISGEGIEGIAGQCHRPHGLLDPITDIGACLQRPSGDLQSWFFAE